MRRGSPARGGEVKHAGVQFGPGAAQDAAVGAADLPVPPVANEQKLLADDSRAKPGNDVGEVQRRRILADHDELRAELTAADQRGRLWASVLQQSGEGIMICDPARRILLVNAAFERITGFSALEAVGQTPAILHSGRQEGEFYVSMWRELTASGHWNGEIWNRRKSGEIYVEWLSLSVVHDAQGATSHYVGIFSDITTRKASEDRLLHLANFDVLTNIPNRSLLIDRLDQLINISRRTERQFALLFIDLDRFKDVNDSLGHYVGDRLLQAVAVRIAGALRPSDTLARMGGDEFMVLLPEQVNTEDVATVARTLIDVLHQPLLLEAQQLSISASIGICIYPEDGATAGELIRNADAAMYRAKGGGPSGYSYYTPELNRRALEKLQTESALRIAIDRNELALYYQPQVDLRSGLIVGAEALVRWDRPGFGIIPPGHFIPLAEERGLIVQIGNWVLHQAMRQAAMWDLAGLPAIRIAVNVSASEFHHHGFVDSIKKAAHEHHIDAARMEFEVTESVAIRDIEAAAAILGELHRLGFMLSLDDFGTGYSSLSYLRRFPIDKIKIDQSFVAELNDKNKARGALLTIRAIISLAKSFSMKVIAEGVENQSQLAHLRAERCDEIQGYLIAKPAPSTEFALLLKNWKPLAQ